MDKKTSSVYKVCNIGELCNCVFFYFAHLIAGVMDLPRYLMLLCNGS